jgi:cell wall-associated NlpC family hydrolase
MNILRERVIEEAMAWLGTPYAHNQHVKGAGVDCLWYLIVSFRPVIPALADFNPGNYARDWYMHRSEELYLEGVKQFAHQIEEPKPADVALYKVGRCVAHAAIILDDTYLIHANAHRKKVVRTERREPWLAEALHSYWSAF